MAAGRKSMSKTFVWIIVGLLSFAMIGFGAAGLGGSIRTIGSVGDKSISVQDYVRELQAQIRGFQEQSGTTITFQQAQAFGIDRRALQQMVTAAALEHEAAQLGLSIGDANLRDQIVQISAFQGPGGAFDRASYRFQLENAGLTEAEFEEDLRSESARTLLQGAVLSATPMPATYAEAMVNFVGETRNFTWSRVGDLQLDVEIAEPDDAQLRAFYDDNIALFTRPETRKITYAWLEPDMLIGDIETSDETLREIYEDRSEIYNQPERRLLERLSFLDAGAADAARARLDAGETDFETLVSDRGLTLSDVDLGDVARSDLTDEAADAVFGAEAGDVVGPVATNSGVALYRVNAVLAEQVTTFEEARPDLLTELQRDSANRMIQAQMDNIIDLLAGGATLEELADETDMQLGQIDWTGDSDSGIAAYAAFRAAASEARVGDFPELEELSDGGIFALRLDAIEEPRAEPFDTVTDRVAEAWRTAETTRALQEQAETMADQLREGRTFAALGLAPNIETGINRRGFIEGAPRALLATAFEMELGDVRVIEADGDAVIVRLDNVMPADLASEDNAALVSSVTDQMSGMIAQDLFQALANDVQARAGISIDQQALTAVHTQFFGGGVAGGGS
ncbi:peptidylprolyl isomerase [Pseudaestuariivita atlantica]|uniref:Parvulin-like PPIase n=1 Tax=Pseudaestuariivita atlantica TaxID=1317121 RepID=A0A0L1JNM0_9RHOB|nr:peptidylprolyl isomerase [Pseudaestuariivita atlantica]KNG92973.1 hypothetical protein ATO11_13655 [Pseudaestuariivita atlantica]